MLGALMFKSDLGLHARVLFNMYCLDVYFKSWHVDLHTKHPSIHNIFSVLASCKFKKPYSFCLPT